VILLWIRYGLNNQRLFEDRANVFVSVVNCYTEQQKKFSNGTLVNLFCGPVFADQIGVEGDTDNSASTVMVF